MSATADEYARPLSVARPLFQVEAPPLTLKDRLGAIEPNWLDWAPAELDSLGREVLMGFFKRRVLCCFGCGCRSRLEC